MNVQQDKLPQAPPDHYWQIQSHSYPQLYNENHGNDTEYVCWGHITDSGSYFIHIAPATSPKATRSWRGKGEESFYNDMHVAAMCVLLGQWKED